MNTVEKRDGRATSKRYGWDSMQVGESHFRFRTPLETAQHSWNAYRAKRPEMNGVRFAFQEAYGGGVIYRRVE